MLCLPRLPIAVDETGRFLEIHDFLGIELKLPAWGSISPAPVIHAHHADGRRRRLLVHAALQRPQKGVLALGRPEARHQAAGWPASGGVGKQTSQVDDTTCPEAVRRHDLRQAIPEGHLHTGGIETSPSCHSEHQLHGGALSRQVLQMTDTPAVAAARLGATCGTPCATGHEREHDPPSVNPVGQGNLDARAGRPLAVRFHAVATHCRRHAANHAPRSWP
jgi:hypothetical protein